MLDENLNNLSPEVNRPESSSVENRLGLDEGLPRGESRVPVEVRVKTSQKPRTEWLDEVPVPSPVRPSFELPKIKFDLKKIAFIAGGAIFLGGVVIGLFSYLSALPEPDYLGLEVLAANTVSVGEKVLFEAVLSNRSGSQRLEDMVLIMRTDDGSVFSDLPGSAFLQKEIGALESQAEFKELIPVIFWGKHREQRRVEVTVRYRLPDRSESYEKTVTWEPVIANAGAQIAISLPQEALSGEIFSGYLTYRNVTAKKFSQSRLVLEPPHSLALSFVEPEASSKDALGNYVWANTDLEPQKEQRVNFKAIISGNDNSGQILKAALKIPVRGKDIALFETNEDLVIVANPFALGLIVNGLQEYSVTPGENLQYKISYKNNYQVSLKDVVIVADFSDTWFDQSSLRLDTGFYSSNTKKITWNGGNTPAILSVDAGESGEVQVYVNAKKIYPLGKTQNELKVKVEISASNKPGSLGTQVLTKTELASKINGRLVLAPRVLFKDSAGAGFVNSGTAQPKVNKVTQYSFYLDLEAQANDFRNVFVTTTFPANISYDGKIKGDTETTDFVFNQRTGQLTWRIDYLPAWQKKGVVFQVAALPSMDQVGHLMPIVEDLKVSGDDVFTLNKFQDTVKGIFSDLPHDNSVNQNTGRVAQ